jgi:glutamate-1-semialdehyde 2,1-aminomutase
MGERLQAGILTSARKRGIPLVIAGFGAAFAVHFTSKQELTTYRDVLEDNTEQLNRYLMAALKEGLYLLPDGRIYVSAVHQESDIDESIAKFDLAFSTL